MEDVIITDAEATKSKRITGPRMTFDELYQALQTRFTLSTRDICQLLKCSRTWCNRYITPFVQHVYISTGRATKKLPNGDKISTGVPWLAILNARRENNGLDKITDAVWFDKNDFLDYIKRHIVSVTQQTIVKRASDIARPGYLARRRELKNKLDEALSKGDYIAAGNLRMAQKAIVYSYLLPGYRDCVALPWQRKKEKPVPVDIDMVAKINNWVAPHDLKDYGDTDEKIYRELFLFGAIRVEIELPDEDGRPGQKIFYYTPPAKKIEDENDEYITVGLEKYQLMMACRG